MNESHWNNEEEVRIREGLNGDADAQLSAQQLQEIIAQELEKEEAQMDTQLIDACCAALDAMAGRVQEAQERALPLSLSRRIRREKWFSARMGRIAVRAAALAACVTLVLFGADVALNRRTMRIAQSDDEQQALISFEQTGSGHTVRHADANADNAFDRVCLASSLPQLWQTAGYALPLPEKLPAQMQCTRAYLLPMGSVDMITVAYEDGNGGCVKIQYWVDETREKVLLGYEKWPDRTEVQLENGNIVLRFPQTDAISGQLNAALIAPHMTCAVTAQNVSEADFAAMLESMGVMEKSAPPEKASFAPQSPLDAQQPVTEYAPPQLHFYSMADMEACVRAQVPIPSSLPLGLAFSYGQYIIDDDWESVTIYAESEDGGFMIYQYEVYETDMADGLNMGVEQNEAGKYAILENGRKAYLSCNGDVYFGIIAGERSMISVHLSGGTEAEVLAVLGAIDALPNTF